MASRRIRRILVRAAKGDAKLTRAGRRSLRFREIGFKVVPGGDHDRARRGWLDFAPWDPLSPPRH